MHMRWSISFFFGGFESISVYVPHRKLPHSLSVSPIALSISPFYPSSLLLICTHCNSLCPRVHLYSSNPSSRLQPLWRRFILHAPSKLLHAVSFYSAVRSSAAPAKHIKRQTQTKQNSIRFLNLQSVKYNAHFENEADVLCVKLVLIFFFGVWFH